MVLETTLEQILSFVGHDGSEIWFPEFPEPLCRRSFHIQEMIHFALQRNFLVVPLEPIPISQARDKWKPLPEIDIREFLHKNKGVLTGETITGAKHAIAWNDYGPSDPGNLIKDISEFSVECFWLITKRI